MSRPLLAAFSGAVVISFSAIFFRLSGVEPVTGAFFRTAYAIPVLAVVWSRSRSLDARTGRQRLGAFAAGLFLAADMTSWLTAVDLIGAGLATLVANTQVVIVPLVTWLALGERPHPIALGSMPVVLTGLALTTGLGRSDAYGEAPVAGVGLAVLAAVFYSGYLIGFRRASRFLVPPAGPLLDATIGATVGSAIIGTVMGRLDLGWVWPGHGWLLASALSSQVVGWLAIAYALPRLPAAHTSFAILLQPTLTILWGGLIFSERASVVQWAGVVLVVASIAAVTLGAGRQRGIERPSPG